MIVFQFPLFQNLTEKIEQKSGTFTDANSNSYTGVKIDYISYDETNGQLLLHKRDEAGADTVIPFNRNIVFYKDLTYNSSHPLSNTTYKNLSADTVDIQDTSSGIRYFLWYNVNAGGSNRHNLSAYKYSTTKVDVSNYNTLHAVIPTKSAKGSGLASVFYVGLASSITNPTMTYVVSGTLGDSSTGGTLNVDISSISGKYYVVAGYYVQCGASRSITFESYLTELSLLK